MQDKEYDVNGILKEMEDKKIDSDYASSVEVTQSANTYVPQSSYESDYVEQKPAFDFQQAENVTNSYVEQPQKTAQQSGAIQGNEFSFSSTQYQQPQAVPSQVSQSYLQSGYGYKNGETYSAGNQNTQAYSGGTYSTQGTQTYHNSATQSTVSGNTVGSLYSTTSSVGNSSGRPSYSGYTSQAAKQSVAYSANTANGSLYNSGQTSSAYQGGGAQPPNNYNSYGSGYGSPQPPKAKATKKGKGKKRLATVSLVLVCLIAGFGGGALGSGMVNEFNTAESSVNSLVEGIPTSVEGSRSINQIAAKAKESVVSIITENLVTNPYFGNQVVSGAGSGVIISEDGYIITNNHVVEGAQSVSVTLEDGNQYPATVVGTDATTDIAVLKIDKTGLTAATISDSNELQVGDFCMAIGNPMGVLSGTVTDGIISALDREISIEGQPMTLLQMDAAVSPGNSGGGLFDENGDLIGIVNAKTSDSNAEGLGFAIPVNTAMEVAQSIIDNGYVKGRPSIGISVVEVTTEAQARQYGVSALGVYVSQLTSGGAAEKAGMQSGDLIVSIDGKEITQTLDISQLLNKKKAGDTISIVVSRDGAERTISLELQELVP